MSGATKMMSPLKERPAKEPSRLFDMIGINPLCNIIMWVSYESTHLSIVYRRTELTIWYDSNKSSL